MNVEKGKQTVTDAGEKMIHLKDYAPFPFKLIETCLSFEIFADRTIVDARLTFEPIQPAAELRLDGDGLKLVGVWIDDVALDQNDYAANADELVIARTPAAPFVLRTRVEIDPAANTQLMGLYRSSGVWCTQCEPEGFRRITYFPDRPDVLSTYTVRIEAGAGDAPILLSNGNMIEAGTLENDRHYAVWQDPFPKPSYLFALVAGDLGQIDDSFTTASGREVKLGIYCEHGKQDRCTYAMDALKRSMVWDEKRFGREYDLDMFNIVAVSDFNFGAMENKGLNVFNDRFVLADPTSATDADYANIERIIAHEYFHNWTGNRITCRDWFQLCLKEGLTVYRDQEFTSDERSRSVKRIEDVLGLRAAQFPEDSGPLAHPARPESYREIENFYTATVYEKGAEIVRMLATLLGPEEFRKGTNLYFERHDGEATTIEAWLKVFEDSSGRDLSQFGKWYLQAGTPTVTVDDKWNPEKQTYTLHLEQKVGPTPGQPDKEPMVLPIRFGLVGPNGHDMTWSDVSGVEIDGDMLVMSGSALEVTFRGVASKPVPSLFRGFSAPVKLVSNASSADRLFLAKHDSDPVNRWQALQDASMDILVGAVRAGGRFELPDDLAKTAEAMGEILQDDTVDGSYKSLALQVPGESAISQALQSDIDPSLVHDVRREMVATIGRLLTDRLEDTFDDLAPIASPYSINAKSARARALRNQCLSLLAASDPLGMSNKVQSHYSAADNMTDRVAALGIAVAISLADVGGMLKDFRRKFAADPIIFDKYLSLTAMQPNQRCLENVQKILAEPDFPKTNPNRLRSLVGGFALGNPSQFARADGAGFSFLAEFCREIDKSNSQLAARLLTAFRNWRTYEPVRRAAARSALETLRTADHLSGNVSDILERTLAELKNFPQA